MALRDFVKVIKKSALLAHLQGVDEKTAKWRKDLLDAVVTKDEFDLQLEYVSHSHDDLTDRDLDEQHPATAIELDVSGFEGLLSSADTDVQLAFDTLDDLDASDSDAIHDNVAGEISAIDEKTVPVVGDIFIIEDSADSWNKKKLQMGNIRMGGAQTDDSIDFDADEGYTGDPAGPPVEQERISIANAPHNGYWYNVSPPEPDPLAEPTCSWRSALDQPIWYDNGWQTNDSCALAQNEAQEYCARLDHRDFSDGQLDIWFRLQHSQRTRFCGIGVVSADSYDESTGVFLGGVCLADSGTGPDVGNVLTTDIREDEGWNHGEIDSQYHNTWAFVKDGGNVQDVAFAYHLRVSLTAGWAKARQWDGGFGVEGDIYPDDDNDWDEEISFGFSLGSPVKIYLIVKPQTMIYGIALSTRVYYLRYVHTVDGIVISDGIDHGQLLGLGDDDHLAYVPTDGTRPMLADWDAGSVEIRAETFESDVATGTAPITVASTTVVTNLNADLLDGEEASAFADAVHTHVEADITDLDHTDATAIHDNVAAEISAITQKASPIGLDYLLIEDSEASNAKKYIKIEDLPFGTTTGGGGDLHFYFEDPPYVVGHDLDTDDDWTNIAFQGFEWTVSNQEPPGEAAQGCAIKVTPSTGGARARWDGGETWTSGVVDVYYRIQAGINQIGGVWIGDSTFAASGIYFGLVTAAGGDTVGFQYACYGTPETYHVHFGSPTNATSYWIRGYIDLDNGLGKMKGWSGAIEDEPAPWGVERTFSGAFPSPAYLCLHVGTSSNAGSFIRIWELHVYNNYVISGSLGDLDHGSLDGLTDDDHTQYLLASGTRGLSANWDAGTFEIRANTFESDVATGTIPLVIASTTKCTNLNADYLDGLHDTAFVKAAGTVALSAAWDAGGYEIRSLKFYADQATGTAPYKCDSTTVNTNLNADLVDGIHGTALLKADGTTALTGDWDAGSFEIRAQTLESDVATGTAPLTIASTTEVTNLNSEFWNGLGVSGTPASETDEFLTYYDSGSNITVTGSGYNQLSFFPRLANDAAITMTVYNNTGVQIDAKKVCYISGDSSGTPLITLADADAESTGSKMLVITNADIANAASGVATIYGWFGGLTGLTASAIQYLSTTDGDITESAPSGSGDIVRIVGYAMSSTEIFFNPSAYYTVKP